MRSSLSRIYYQFLVYVNYERSKRDPMIALADRKYGIIVRAQKRSLSFSEVIY